jgi:hypothetical protein
METNNLKNKNLYLQSLLYLDKNDDLENEKQCDIHDVSNSVVRPPLGLVPKFVRQKERYYEVCGAIARYYDAGKKIPIEWVEEYNELVEIVGKCTLTVANIKR